MDIAKAFDYVRNNDRAVMLTTRKNGAPAMAPVNVGVVDDEIVLSTRQTAMKIQHLKRDPRTSLCVFPHKWLGRWVQLNCTTEIVDLPEAMDILIEYYRSVSGEHPDWDDYRRAMTEDQRCIVKFTIESAGPDQLG